MRCPQCSAVCSDLRDICPKCMCDLRAQKKQIGLKVANPGLTYEQLRDKEIKRRSNTGSGATQVTPMKPSESGGFFSNLFKTLDATPAAHEAHPPSPPTPIETVIEPVVRSLQETVVMLNAPSASRIEHTEPETTVPMERSQGAPQIEIELVSEILEPPVIELTTPIPSEPLHPPTVHTEPNAPVSPKNVTPYIPDRTAVESAFSDATESLSHEPARIGFELLSEQLHSEHNPERIELFFNLAMESFENPGLEERYETKIESSESKKLDTSSLESQLKRTERAVDSPIMGLKARRPIVSSQEQKGPEHEEIRLPVPPAPAPLRAAAAIVDVLVMILISLGATAFIFGDIPEGVDSLVAPAMIPMYGTALEIFLGSTVLYPLLSLLVFGNTAGCSVVGLSVVAPDGSPASPASLLVRCISLPLSTTLLGFIPMAWGRLPLHDIVSASTVYAGQPLVFET